MKLINSKRYRTILAIGAAAAATLLLAACGNMVSGPGSEEARGAITPTVTSSVVSAADIDNFSVTISGSDIESSTQSFSGGSSSLELQVSPGERTFSVAGTITDAESFVTEVTGEATAQVTAGETTRVTVNLDEITDSRILFADGANQRVVMMDDMEGNGWQEFSSSDPSFGEVYDVDYDGRGRIYVAAQFGLFRMDNMQGEGLVQLNQELVIQELLASSSAWSVAVDKDSSSVSFLVGGTNAQVVHGELDTTQPWTADQASILSVSTELPPAALTSLPDGRLVLGSGASLLVFEPQSPTNVSFYDAAGSGIQDLMVSDGLVWSLGAFSTTGNVVVEADPEQDFQKVGGFGTITGSEVVPTEQEEFAQPVTFGATARDGFYVGDADPAGSLYDLARVAYFTDSNGVDWSTFGNYGAQEGQFSFYFALPGA